MPQAPSTGSQDPENGEFLLNLRAALPQSGGALRGLPAIDWGAQHIDPALVPMPVDLATADWPDSAPLPAADMVVMTWTIAEWAALDHVFCDHQKEMTVADAKSKTWRAPWAFYRRNYSSILEDLEKAKKAHWGVPSLDDKAWGSFRMVTLGDKKVLLIKSAMHLAQDGPTLPLTQFVDQVCQEVRPHLLLSIGTAGAVRFEDARGAALVSNQALFMLEKAFKDEPFNKTTVKSPWVPKGTFVPQAQALCIPVPGYPVYPVSPQYPQETIEPLVPDSRIKLVVERPIITTDTFLFGTTTNELWTKGCIVEMDDAVVGLRAQMSDVPFGFVRNASDPVMNGMLPPEVQRAWATYIYQERGLFTSFNGALATWAMLAGFVAGKGP